MKTATSQEAMKERWKEFLSKLTRFPAGDDLRHKSLKKQAHATDQDYRRWILGRLHTLAEGLKDG